MLINPLKPITSKLCAIPFENFVISADWEIILKEKSKEKSLRNVQISYNTSELNEFLIIVNKLIFADTFFRV